VSHIVKDFLPLIQYLNSFVEEEILPNLSPNEFSVIRKFIQQLMLKPENFETEPTELSDILFKVYDNISESALIDAGILTGDDAKDFLTKMEKLK